MWNNLTPVLIALIVFALSMSLFSLFIAGLVRRSDRPQWHESTTYPPHPGYYSVQENRRVYNRMEAQ